MTIRADAFPERKFVSTFLPWIVAVGALGVYLATLNRWVSFGNLAQVATMSGWTWQPQIHGPAYWLLTYPMRWLPVESIPLALNVFSAVCATLCLGLLVRSVTLLPHDRTQAQRDKELGDAARLSIPTAWLPPVLAALVCGLQLTFWENATAASSQFYTGGSSEMFDLLLFAYVIRCLLEFRVEQRESWLIRGTFVYGVAMTNSWAMIGFFPLFLIALVWLNGLSFFSLRFLSRLGLCGLAGLLLYLLLPLVASLSHTAAIPFWTALKADLVSQKNILLMLYKFGRQNVMLLCLTSLVPVFIISIRWASYFGDSSQLGIALASLMFHVVHALFLVACIWVALDPPVSPRNKGFGVPFLTFYYLGALSIGYFSGYFLLLFGGRTEGRRRPPAYVSLINRIVTGAIWLLLFLAPVALVCRNLPQVLVTNGTMLSQYAALLAKGLPPRGAVLMSDDARRSYLLQSWAAQKGKLKDYLFIDSAGGPSGPLTNPEYHRYLKRRYQQGWPVEVPKGYIQPVDESFLVQLALRLAATNSLYYLHPSFGYYFEFFYLEPHGLLYKLNRYPTNLLVAPPPSVDAITENNAFWAEAGNGALKPLLAAVTQGTPDNRPGVIDELMERAHLSKASNHDARVLAGFYSRALNYWGIELQKAGHLANAAAMFGKALALNPDNLVVRINLECNGNLQAGHETTVQVSGSVEDEFGKYRTWDQIIGENGPFDEPNYSFGQGLIYVHNNLHHQAAQQFDRVKTLAPRNLLARIWLAQLYVVNSLPSQAMQLITEIRAHPALFPVPSTNRTEMLFVETSAHLASGDVKGAEAAVQSALREYPGDDDLLATATQVYINYQCYSNALATVEQELKVSETNIMALINKGLVCIRLGAFEQAIPPLTRVLSLETNQHSALFNRAIANLRCSKLEAAQQDYEALQKTFPTATQIYYGLAEIARLKKDTNTAVRNYQLYLSKAQTNTAEAHIVRERLKELRPGPR
jgi:tetratricopeptide (TPR) repeat protein